MALAASHEETILPLLRNVAVRLVHWLNNGPAAAPGTARLTYERADPRLGMEEHARCSAASPGLRSGQNRSFCAASNSLSQKPLDYSQALEPYVRSCKVNYLTHL